MNQDVTEVFKSREELMEWVQNIARQLGYVIITKRSKTRPSGYVSKVILMCDRGGVYRSVKDTSKDSGSKKTNCPFQLAGKYTKEYDCWTLRVICDEHNHPPAQHMEGHPFARRLSDNETQLVAELTRKHVAPRDILGILKEQNENNVSTLKTIYNARNKIREADQEGKTPMQVLMSLLHVNGYIFEFCTNSVSNELEALFFVHPTSFEISRAFPHVLIMDATYKTNKYNMPFLQIVGVTSTNKTFSIAFAFMHKEMEANYAWALNCLKSTLADCMQPRVIITDRELALMNACQQVFPNATRLLCRWHISENIFKKCRPSINSQHDWDSFISKWNLLIESQTWTSYMENYMQLHATLIEYPGVLNYLDQVWLNKYKEMFVSVWIDQCLNYGNRTTNRVESQHAKLKKYLRSTNSTLDKFVGCIDEIVLSQFTAIKESFEKSKIVLKHQHNLPCFKLLHGFVSNEALDIIVGELKRSTDLQLNSSNCGCQLRKSCGLPCACVVSMYLNAGQCIPLDSIDIFWRKLDFSPCSYMESDDITCDSEIEMFKQSFENQSRSGKKSFLKKLKEIFDPSTSLVEEPIVQKNTRGRPSLKKQQQKIRVDPTTQDPRRRSCSATSTFMDLNPSPARHSSYTNFRTSYFHPLMTEIPNIFHPYITHMQDVLADGHCGFRAIAVCLGHGEEQWADMRYQLWDELYQAQLQYRCVFTTSFDELYTSLYFSGSGPASSKHWMIMPDTGVLIANRFGVIVHCLSNQGCMTCFPLWKGPEEILHHQTLTIAHVHGNHYVMVRLEGEYPMPTITPLWNYHKHPSAVRWQTMYMPRLEIYTQFNRANCHFSNVVIDV